MSTPDLERRQLGLGFAPEWADAWGEDKFGVFASFVVGEVEQRMRWIPPGTFWMVSPDEDREIRDEEEHPYHQVKLTHGFWMMDTACTQALWETVMGDNPSGFWSPRRPVEQVSWDDVQEFIARLNDRVRGLDAGLPTEAQWEYACRAGTTTATYAGPLEVLGENRAPVLNEIAWYRGNRGFEFDLDKGVDSSAWPNKQFEHVRGGTREVALKQPNSWGLYDMLGNVWEWCADGKRDYEQAAVVNPTGPSGQDRVIRGGGWVVDARKVRAAYRGWRRPGYRYADLGFRLVRGQGLRQAGQAGQEERKGEQARAGDPPGGRRAPPQKREGQEQETSRPRVVILLINVIEHHHQRVSEGDARTVVDEPNAVVFAVEQVLDRATTSPRKWRAMARKVDQVVEVARAAVIGPARYVVVGRAPLPVFAYLGMCMSRTYSISVANDFFGKMELFGSPEDCPPGGADEFNAFSVSAEPNKSEGGRAVLSILCSHEYSNYSSSMMEMLAAEHVNLSASYEIRRERSQRDAPLTSAELPVILQHVERGLGWIGERRADALALNIAGPIWVAFWVGRRLNPAVHGRIDLPNFVPGTGYARALAYPMRMAPWLVGEPKILSIYADPTDHHSHVHRVIERAFGDAERYHFRSSIATRIRAFMAEVESFRPDILNLWLHSDPEGQIVFENEHGQVNAVEINDFVAQLRATRVEPTLIVLVTSYATTFAPSFVGLAECVVAVNGPAQIAATREFLRYFYEAVSRGKDLATAIQQGKVGAGQDIVEACTIDDVSVDDIILMPCR